MDGRANDVRAAPGPGTGPEALAWSRYNRLFESRRYGFFLYNALSNELFKLDEPHARAAEGLRAAGSESGASDDAGGGDASAALARLAAAEPEFAERLRAARVLVAPGEEAGGRLAAGYARRAARFDTAALGLTICPTLACNFRCGYCFEHSQADGLTMSAETIDRLLDFIGSFKDVNRVALAWYGGEPTLAWDVVREVTRRVRAAGFADPRGRSGDQRLPARRGEERGAGRPGHRLRADHAGRSGGGARPASRPGRRRPDLRAHPRQRGRPRGLRVERTLLHPRQRGPGKPRPLPGPAGRAPRALRGQAARRCTPATSTTRGRTGPPTDTP